MKVLKYWSISEDKKSLILLPSKVGIEIIKRALTIKGIKFTDGIEKIDKCNLLSIIVPLPSPYKFVEFRIGSGIVNIYIYCEDESKYYILFPESI